MPKRWCIANIDRERVAALQQSAGVPNVVAQLLLCRGIDDPAAARQFLDAKLTGLRDPDELPGVPQAAELLHRAVSDRRRIVIYGDYDADGMTATAILLLCLRLLKADVEFYVPNRMDEGYGLNDSALRTLAGRGAQVVVTVDCGISSVAQAETAAELGLELIISDHHELAERLPAAAAIVHPRLPGSSYPFPGLCGAAVAFKLAWALCQRASQAKRVSPPLKNYLMQAVGLAAIGTVADVVPLIDENRILVRHGLSCLRHYPTPGIVALERAAKLTDKPTLSCEDIGFAMAPRLNAAGRLGQAPLAIELLSTTSPARAEQLASFLTDLNERRQSLERSVFRSAHRQARDQFSPGQDPALVLSDPDWHPGVIGIVAGRLAEKYHCPVILVAHDKLAVQPGTGSGRGVSGFDLHHALDSCSGHLVSFGGHAAAAGLKIDAPAIDAFRIDFCAHTAQLIPAAARIAELHVDAEAPLAALTCQTVGQIEQMAPFGHGNERPTLCTTDVRLAAPPRRIGAAGNHLSLQIEQHGVKMRAVAFGGGDWEDELNRAGNSLAIAFKPVINTFGGRRRVEMHLTDWRAQVST